MNIRSDIAGEFNAIARKGGWTVTARACTQFENDSLRRLHGIWRAAAGGRPMPARSDFTARALGPYLRNITFIECVGQRFRFRFFGSALSHISGDHTGRFVDEVVPEAQWQSWQTGYSLVRDSATPLQFVSYYKIPFMSHLRGDSLLAPLADAQGDVAGFLSASFFGPR